MNKLSKRQIRKLCKPASWQTLSRRGRGYYTDEWWTNGWVLVCAPPSEGVRDRLWAADVPHQERVKELLSDMAHKGVWAIPNALAVSNDQHGRSWVRFIRTDGWQCWVQGHELSYLLGQCRGEPTYRGWPVVPPSPGIPFPSLCFSVEDKGRVVGIVVGLIEEDGGKVPPYWDLQLEAT